MISKYNGTCRYCKLPTKAGQDHYELETKTGYHALCQEAAENAGPSDDQRVLAEKLGYREFSWESLRILSGGALDERERPDCATPERGAVRNVRESDTISINDVRGEEGY